MAVRERNDCTVLNHVMTDDYIITNIVSYYFNLIQIISLYNSTYFYIIYH